VIESGLKSWFRPTLTVVVVGDLEDDESVEVASAAAVVGVVADVLKAVAVVLDAA
jgi:Tfp pilus assembly pilus retraction ATPase PilT